MASALGTEQGPGPGCSSSVEVVEVTAASFRPLVSRGGHLVWAQTLLGPPCGQPWGGQGKWAAARRGVPPAERAGARRHSVGREGPLSGWGVLPPLTTHLQSLALWVLVATCPAHGRPARSGSTCWSLGSGQGVWAPVWFGRRSSLSSPGLGVASSVPRDLEREGPWDPAPFL